MALSNSHGDSTITPPPTPTSPRFTALPIQSHHIAPCVSGRKGSSLSLSQSINTSMALSHNTTSSAPNSKMTLPSSNLYTSPDGVWENSTPYSIMHEAPIGTGLWSSVYLATPNTEGKQAPITIAGQHMATATSPLESPPTTPIRRRGQSNSVSSTDSYMTQFSSSTAASSSQTAAAPATMLNIISDSIDNDDNTNSRAASTTSTPAVWAIKAPADRAAFSVIRSEARMLTHIFSSASSTMTGNKTTPPTDFMVPFLGLDPRSGGLLMQALPLTLEDLIRGDLESFSSFSPSSSALFAKKDEVGEMRRARLIAELFPRLAVKLLAGMEWIHEEAGVVHADIKPSNILLRPTGDGVAEAMVRERLSTATAAKRMMDEGAVVAPLGRPSLLARSSSSSSSSSGKEAGEEDDDGDDVRIIIDFEPLYTDFSAAIPIRPFPSPSASLDPTSPPMSLTTKATAPPPHLAGGTWDFLAPELCRLHPSPAPPSPASDVYALGVALTCVVLGESPFEALAGGNAFRKREMVKCGDAVGFALGVSGGRFARVKREASRMWGGWDLERWLRKGLVRKVEGRVGAREWREEVEGSLVL